MLLSRLNGGVGPTGVVATPRPVVAVPVLLGRDGLSLNKTNVVAAFASHSSVSLLFGG